MNGSDFTDEPTWSGRQVARQISEAHPRQRVVVTRTIVSAVGATVGPSPAYRVDLSDGTGRIGLVFIGRSSVSGMAVGARATVEGTARRAGADLVIWNPIYRLEGCPPK